MMIFDLTFEWQGGDGQVRTRPYDTRETVRESVPETGCFRPNPVFRASPETGGRGWANPDVGAENSG